MACLVHHRVSKHGTLKKYCLKFEGLRFGNLLTCFDIFAHDINFERMRTINRYLRGRTGKALMGIGW